MPDRRRSGASRPRLLDLFCCQGGAAMGYANAGFVHQPVGHFSGADEGREAMEMPWASKEGMREAIPPRYAEHVGGYLMAHLRTEVAA